MKKVFANCLVANTRSQRVLAKTGFDVTKRDEAYLYYECCYSAWLKQNSYSKTGKTMDDSL
jgi:RimJ/RimL family protein N-acetyltransferase